MREKGKDNMGRKKQTFKAFLKNNILKPATNYIIYILILGYF